MIGIPDKLLIAVDKIDRRSARGNDNSIRLMHSMVGFPQ
jgi:hypothetical protein